RGETPAIDREESRRLKDDTHIELSALAQCADGTLPRDEARTVREHLAECRSCLAAYVDAVRYRAAWLADSEAFRLEDDDRALVGLERSTARSPAEPGGNLGTFRRLALIASVAAVAAVSVRIARGPDAPSVGFRLEPATLEASARASAGGLVL